MNCDELLPHLPLLALDESDPSLDGPASEHLRQCERCRARLDALQSARAALDAADVPEMAPLSGAAIREAHPRPEIAEALGGPTSRDFASPRPWPRRWKWSAAAAAAALLFCASGAGFLSGRIAGAAEVRAAADAIPRETFAGALLSLDARLASLEERHERDLYALAQAVDRQQLRDDRRVTERIDALAEATRTQLVFTRGAISDLAQFLHPAVQIEELREH